MNQDLEQIPLETCNKLKTKEKIPIEEQRKKWRHTWYENHKEEHKQKCSNYYNENKKDIKLKRDVKNIELPDDEIEEIKIKKSTYDNVRYYLKKQENWDGFKDFKNLYNQTLK